MAGPKSLLNKFGVNHKLYRCGLSLLSFCLDLRCISQERVEIDIGLVTIPATKKVRASENQQRLHPEETGSTRKD